MVLFHFIFEIVKISFQASIYAVILLVFSRIASISSPNSFLGRVSQKKLKFWWSTGFVMSISLFVFSFTYWGDHGLGDSSRIPVGHGKAINNTDTWTYFYTPDNDQRHIYKFEIHDDKLFAEQNGGRYLLFDFETSQLKEFENKGEYDEYSIEHNYPRSSDLRDFYHHYDKYWNGWRFWLLA